MEPEDSLPQSQVPATCPYPEPAGSLPKDQSWPEAHLSIPLQGQFLGWGVVCTSPKLQAEVPPLVCCLRLFIQYIRS